MDFRGQRLAEAVGVWLVTVGAVIGFLFGYAQQDFSGMLTMFGGSLALAALLTVPDWPPYNRHPVKWLPPRDAAPGGKAGRGGGGKDGGGGGVRPKKKAASWSSLWGALPGLAAA